MESVAEDLGDECITYALALVAVTSADGGKILKTLNWLEEACQSSKNEQNGQDDFVFCCEYERGRFGQKCGDDLKGYPESSCVDRAAQKSPQLVIRRRLVDGCPNRCLKCSSYPIDILLWGPVLIRPNVFKSCHGVRALRRRCQLFDSQIDYKVS